MQNFHNKMQKWSNSRGTTESIRREKKKTLACFGSLFSGISFHLIAFPETKHKAQSYIEIERKRSNWSLTSKPREWTSRRVGVGGHIWQNIFHCQRPKEVGLLSRRTWQHKKGMHPVDHEGRAEGEANWLCFLFDRSKRHKHGAACSPSLVLLKHSELMFRVPARYTLLYIAEALQKRAAKNPPEGMPVSRWKTIKATTTAAKKPPSIMVPIRESKEKKGYTQKTTKQKEL